jgi:indolepyruvate ferredoxin oxidoreductase
MRRRFDRDAGIWQQCCHIPALLTAKGHHQKAEAARALEEVRMGEPFPLREVALEDKYDLSRDLVFLNGTQAIVRMLLMQRERDRRAGLDTAGFVSGYRGSPLGGLDQQLFRSRRQLEAAGIVFQPGLNEELAATACWGSQQAELSGQGKHNGVFALWYGKGPGVDRTTDVFRHANLAGSSRHGGAIALMGDDHTAESSTVAHQTEFNFVDTMIPILNPAGVQELMDYGLHGYALSRFAGTWAALKCVKENVESTASVDGSIDRVSIVLPEFEMPPGGLNIRHELDFVAQEARLHEFKRAAAVAYIAANKLNRIVYRGGPKARIGIVSVGKSYLDVKQALDDLGIDEKAADRIGLRLFKIACPWPMIPEEIMSFAKGLETIIVVEEKRSLIEVQVKEELYGTGNQPTVVGKRDEAGGWLFPVKGALDPNDMAIAIGERVLRFHKDDRMSEKVSALRQAQARLAETVDVGTRTPYFCSGCPHNTSTRVPEGSRASAGIGCHYMALWMDRETAGFTAMGGEGANWVGEAPFSKTGHIFQNLGDGTYNHSGVLALRWAVASKTNITYKILFNDAVAMTGGQPHEGGLTVDMIANQVRAEGVERIAIVTDEPEKYSGKVVFPAGASVHHRSELDAVQRELRDTAGVTVVIYDQTCAAEKRRRRKRGTFPDPDKRVIINELVCEGCGDCGVKSNCVSVQPLETEFGRKRRIDQSSCNKDFSCVEGFCPSFVTVHGARIRKAEPAALAASEGGIELPPEPELPSVENENWACIVTGVGGTGVVTIGAIMGMAAHLEGKGCGMIDMAGLAQKGGSVYSHVKIGRNPDAINAIRVSAGKASLILGGDLVVSGTRKVLAAVRHGATLFVANTAEVMGGEFTRSADFSLPTERLKRAIASAAGRERVSFVDATGLATALFGNSIAANMFLLGYAHQKGGVPLSSAAIEKAIGLNGEAVKMNVEAFRWGRRTAHDQKAVEDMVAARRATTEAREISASLPEMVAKRVAFLTDYQDAAYAARYQAAVSRIQKAEMERAPGRTELTKTVARYFFKLLAYKDEYEVARLYADGAFLKQLQAEFEGDMRLEFHLAPPLLGKKDAEGRPLKTSFGPWMLKAFAILAKLKGLRGTKLDIFGYTGERRTERRLIAEYEGMIDFVAARLTPANHAVAVGLAAIPEKIRGYGHVKERRLTAALAERDELMRRFGSREPQPMKMAAE